MCYLYRRIRLQVIRYYEETPLRLSPVGPCSLFPTESQNVCNEVEISLRIALNLTYASGYKFPYCYAFIQKLLREEH